MEHNMELITSAFYAMLKDSNDIVFVKDENLVYRAASMPFVKMVGKQNLSEIINHTDLEIFEDTVLARRYVIDDTKLLKSGENLINYIEPIPEENGQARYGSTSKYLLTDVNNKTIGILGITRDITKEYFARQHYQQELKYLFKLPKDTYAVSYIDIDDWRIINQRRQNIHDSSLQACFTVEELCDAAATSITDRDSDASHFYRNFSPDVLREIYNSGKISLSFKYQRYMADGSVHWVDNTIRFLIDVDSSHLCAMLTARDIDAQVENESLLKTAARMDQMTMVLNRETTMESIRKTLIENIKQTHVLFMMDIDNFKTINDTFGHQAGDEFLIKLASEIKTCFRESDLIGRIGGDEFFALMKNVDDMESAIKKANDLMTIISQVCTDYPTLSLSASIGISVYPTNGRTLEKLYSEADTALYEAKRTGKNKYIFAQKHQTVL